MTEQVPPWERPASPSYQSVLDEYGRWLEGAKYRDDRDPSPMSRAAALHLKRGKGIPLAEVAPCLAIIYFASVEFEGSGLVRLICRSTVWFLRTLVYRGRPMWNDFYMCLWQLSRDPRYIGELHHHLQHASSMQKGSGEWMVGSVCGQDAEFAEHWGDVVRERGPVFDGDLMRFIQGEAR